VQRRSKLDVAANIAIILVCIIASIVLVRNHLMTPEAPGAAHRGERLAALGRLVPEGADRALVLVVQPGCHFCTESLPFYKRLLDQRNQRGSGVKVIAAVPQAADAAAEEKSFAAAGAHPDAFSPLDFQSAKVPGTPTLMLVDRAGKVLDVWVGKLDGGREDEVLKKL
nr:hypothetical protein [Acidobacteriota bacterium]